LEKYGVLLLNTKGIFQSSPFFTGVSDLAREPAQRNITAGHTKARISNHRFFEVLLLSGY